MTILVQQQLRDLLGKLTTAFWRNDGLLVCPAYREGGTVYVESWRPLAEASTKDYARFIAAANPGAVLALLDEIDQLKAENAELIDLMRRVVAEHPRRSHKNGGNGPGHGHAVPGVWDEDNGELAGKPCAWCSIWNAAKGIVERHEQAMTKEQP